MSTMINLHILDSSGRLNNYEESIRRLSIELVAKIGNLIPLHPVDVVVKDNPDHAIPETGMGGSTETPSLVVISIDLDHKNINDNFEKEFKSTLAHELHHTVRNNKYPWPGTLLQDAVSEGLADHFDLEINGGEPKPWSTALNQTDLFNILNRAKPIFEDKNYSHQNYNEWFFGSKEKDIPRWAGYSIGNKIVDDYMRKTGKKASELVFEDPNKFIPF